MPSVLHLISHHSNAHRTHATDRNVRATCLLFSGSLKGHLRAAKFGLFEDNSASSTKESRSNFVEGRLWVANSCNTVAESLISMSRSVISAILPVTIHYNAQGRTMLLASPQKYAGCCHEAEGWICSLEAGRPGAHCHPSLA